MGWRRPGRAENFDGFDHARGRLLAHGRQLRFRLNHFVIVRKRRNRALRLHVDDRVAAGLEVGENLRKPMRGRLLEVVHEQNALAVFFELGIDRGNHLLGLAHFEVERIHVGREHRDIASPRYFTVLRMMRCWKTKERRFLILRAEHHCTALMPFSSSAFASPSQGMRLPLVSVPLVFIKS